MMRPLGPFAADRRVAVAVSGGADSMALAWLLAQWGSPHAILVDHGLRPGSDVEVMEAAGRLSVFGVPATIVTLRVLRPGAAAARAARYDALTATCARLGHVELCLGHHARDQAETVLMRRDRGSGPAGLAGMSALTVRRGVRLLRPLLAVDPARLRTMLQIAGVGWFDDPGNDDPATVRGGMRQAFRRDPSMPIAALDSQAMAALARRVVDRAVAQELAATVTILPSGAAEVNGLLSEPALSALIWTVSGRPFPPRPALVARATPMRAQTLHGVQIARAGTGWRVMREPSVTERRFYAGHFQPGRPICPTEFVLPGHDGDADCVPAPHV